MEDPGPTDTWTAQSTRDYVGWGDTRLHPNPGHYLSFIVLSLKGKCPL